MTGIQSLDLVDRYRTKSGGRWPNPIPMEVLLRVGESNLIFDRLVADSTTQILKHWFDKMIWPRSYPIGLLEHGQ